MYLKNIAIKNIGPIDQISVELPFKEDGNPKPIVFVGENGSGKTILQSQIIDALYEVSGEVFSNVRKLEGTGYKYYKVSGGLNLKSGQNKGFSIVKFSNNIEYFDKIGDVKIDDFKSLIPEFSLHPNNENNNQKHSTEINETKQKELETEWLGGVYFYQPAYRYEEPFWKNEIFLDTTRFEDKKRFSNHLNKELEIITSTKENKTFLMDLVLDFSINQQNILDQITRQNINGVLRKIKRQDDIRFGIGRRGRNRVAIVKDNKTNGIVEQILPSIDNLSLGESVLLNLFINIIRHGDNSTKTLDQIQGIVAIDEIDVHLHTDLQSMVLPELIRIFPKIQFVITTHSPLFLLGMKKIFGEDGFEIRNMPNGEIITTERFSEFENAYKALKETEKFEADVKKEIEKATKPILFVEGDYDIKYINKAGDLLSHKDILEKISIYDAGGFGNLDKIWKNYDSKLSDIVPQNILLLYDCDTNKQDSTKGKVIKKVIPTIKDNIIKKGIENLFTDDTIKRAKTSKSAFIDYTPEVQKEKRGETIKEPERYDINKDEKGNLCDWICTNGVKEDFEKFETIFEIICTSLQVEKNQPSTDSVVVEVKE